MSEEAFQIVQQMDLSKIEAQMALHCAPVITNIKISNLITVAREDEESLRVILRKTGIQYFRLYRAEDKSTFLLFHREKLEKCLKTKGARELLTGLGYTDLEFGQILRNFQKRFCDCRVQGEKFPHEIGLLLGYPLEDVIGFIENEGRNYLYSGYWKVYADVERKVELFEAYEKAKDTLIYLLAIDMPMRKIMETYQYETNIA